MVMTLDIPESALREAETRGVSVEKLIQEKFAPETDFASRPGFTRLGPGPKTPAEAGADIREMQKKYTLGSEVTIKQLIEEGRRHY